MYLDSSFIQQIVFISHHHPSSCLIHHLIDPSIIILSLIASYYPSLQHIICHCIILFPTPCHIIPHCITLSLITAYYASLYYIFTHSYLWPYYLKHKSIDIYIINKNTCIQARCSYGRQHNLQCNQSYHSTELWAIVCDDHVKPIYVPVIQCTYHCKISKIYGWLDDEKFIPGPGDEICNFGQIWTGVRFGGKNPRRTNNWSQPYHFSDLALEQFMDNFIDKSYDVL